jgi:hypothetical protein
MNKLMWSIIAVVVTVVSAYGITEKPKESNAAAALLGDWKRTEQYSWNDKTKAWDPGIVDESGKRTAKVNSKSVMHITASADLNVCPFVTDAKTETYVTAPFWGGCAKVIDASTLEIQIDRKLQKQMAPDHPELLKARLLATWKKVNDQTIELVVSGMIDGDFNPVPPIKSIFIKTQ